MMKVLICTSIVLLVLLIPHKGGSAQGTMSDLQIRVSGAASVFKYDGWVGEKGIYHPAVTGSLRIHFFRFFYSEAVFSGSWTRRYEEYACFPACSFPKRVSGKLLVWTGGGGIHIPGETWGASIGAAYGWTEDKQPGDMLDFDGPTWSGVLGLERRYSSCLRLMAEWRVHRMHWHNKFQGLLKDVHLTNHQLNLGVSWNLW